MPVNIEAYLVVCDSWTVCGPGGVNVTASYADEASAQHQAAMLNAAYNAGRVSGIADASPIQQCSRVEGHGGPCNGVPRKTCKGWPA